MSDSILAKGQTHKEVLLIQMGKSSSILDEVYVMNLSEYVMHEIIQIRILELRMKFNIFLSYYFCSYILQEGETHPKNGYTFIYGNF